MRKFLWTLALMAGVAGAVQAAAPAAGEAAASEVVHSRGEYAFSVGPVPDFVQVSSLAERWDDNAPGHDDKTWRLWLFDEQIDRRKGRDHVYVDYAWEARASSLLGAAGKFDVTFNPEYQRLVIHRVALRRNGQWLPRLSPERISLARREEDFEKDMADGNVTALVVLEDVRVDDVVRITYSIIGSNPILGGQLVDSNRFAWRGPMLDVNMRVLYDPGIEPLVVRENNPPEAAIRRTPEATEVTVRAHATAAVPDEGSYPVWYQPYPTVRSSASRRWADVVSWALPLYPKPGALPAELESKLAQWAKLPDPHARLSAALRTVQDEVRYFGVEMGDNTHRPHTPEETWARRYGDCKDKTYLLVTLLERLGIEAAPALVSTTRGRAIASSPPAASLFNHVIVRARLGGQSYWVDPTVTSQGGQARDSDLSDYGVGLVIAPGTSGVETIAAPTIGDRGVHARETYELLADGRAARLRIQTTYRGPSADEMRHTLAGESHADRSRRYADYYRKRFGEVDVVAPVGVQDDRAGNVLVVDEEYLLKSPYEATGSDRALDVQGESLAMAARLPQSMARTGPLEFSDPGRFRHEIQVTLPARWIASVRDEKISYASDAFDYTRDMTVKDRSIQVVFDMDVRRKDVSQDQVARHLGELRKVRETLSARLRLQVPGEVQSKERDDRLKALLQDVLDDGAQP